MQVYGEATQPSPFLAEPLNAGFRCLEVGCARCDICIAFEPTTLPRKQQTTIWQPVRRKRCRPCSEQRRSSYKRVHVVRLRRTHVTAAEIGKPQDPEEQGDLAHDKGLAESIVMFLRPRCSFQTDVALPEWESAPSIRGAPDSYRAFVRSSCSKALAIRSISNDLAPTAVATARQPATACPTSRMMSCAAGTFRPK
ncbi:hypothetical protein [Bradyrhizobium sp.]|uniref:hypothetical protein n=1 Tax=Bradyrhizobium sp. TaxID=376 RepID=UPI003C35B676